MDDLTDRLILIVEDGDEYLDSLSRFVPGPRYLQARSAAAAVELLQQWDVELIYLDMRFDRIPLDDLVGDHAAATRARNGDATRGWRLLQNNQGLYILDALNSAGFGDRPTIISYDFSREPARWRRLAARYPALTWVADTLGPEDVRRTMLRSMARRSNS